MTVSIQDACIYMQWLNVHFIVCHWGRCYKDSCRALFSIMCIYFNFHKNNDIAVNYTCKKESNYEVSDSDATGFQFSVRAHYLVECIFDLHMSFQVQ